MDESEQFEVERGVLTSSAELWSVAVRRAEVISELACHENAGADRVNEAAAALGLSRRYVYELLRRWHAGEGVASDLLPGRRGAPAGRRLLSPAVEDVIREAIRTHYLSRQRRSVAAVYREVARLCRLQGLPLPSRGSLVRRIGQIDAVKQVGRREGADAVRARQSAGGVVPPVRRVLDQVQIDHTPVDVIVVDERHRLPIGRPYITVGIDVYSRSIVGLVVTLEAPSALSAGLCLSNMVTDKRGWLERLGVDASWPMSGKPAELYLDNAAEFHSDALRRGCEQHGIRLRYRPPGQPHYGGVVERVIGTMMKTVHELPGTTFSNPHERGSYDSEKTAALTLKELERWLVLAIASYHGSVHGGIGRTPAGRWNAGLAEAVPVVVVNPAAFLIDFLPVIRRTLTRSGFTIDHVQYFSDALKPWIARREKLGRFVIRRDPRDISRVWVLDPEGIEYMPVPYRRLSHPPVTVWEQKAAVAALRAEGRADVDEEALFRQIELMRDVVTAAARTTKRARRHTERRTTTPSAPRTSTAALIPPIEGNADLSSPEAAAPFAEIEEW